VALMRWFRRSTDGEMRVRAKNLLPRDFIVGLDKTIQQINFHQDTKSVKVLIGRCRMKTSHEGAAFMKMPVWTNQSHAWFRYSDKLLIRRPSD
jgi:hypothetical protein